MEENQKKIKAKRWASKTAAAVGLAVGINVMFSIMGGDIDKIIGAFISALWIPIGWSIAYGLGHLSGD
jgi:hypothetical protein